MKEIEEYIRTVTTKGQVTIPVEVRRLLEVSPGDQVVFRVKEGTVELMTVSVTMEEAFGAVTPRSRPEDLASLRQIAIEEHVRKVIEEMND